MTGHIAAAPLRTLLLVASFAVTGYAGVRLLEGDVLGIVLWFVGAALLHDLVLLPLYTVLDHGLQRVARGRHVTAATAPAAPPLGVNYVRVPVFVSGMLLLVFYPLVLGMAQRYEPYTGLDLGVFWERWLLLTAGLFAASALAFAVRALRARRPASGEKPHG